MKTIERLTVREAGYLHLERSGVPSTIGWAGLLDLSAGDCERYIRQLRALLERRAHHVPRLRQRVLPVPLFCGLPVWTDDPAFDIANHVRLERPAAGEHQGLDTVAEHLFATPVDMTKPLWNLWLIPGLAFGRAAIVIRVHHAIADGVGMAAISAALLAGDGDHGDTLFWRPRPAPSAIALAIDNLHWRMSTLGDALALVAHPLRCLRRTGEMVRQMRDLWHRSRDGKGISLNASLGETRRLNIRVVSLAEVKAAGHQHAATVNDVLLCAVGGGLRRLVHSRGETDVGLMHAAEGVSLRTPGDLTVGNRAGGWVVPLHADIADCRRRLTHISADTRALKTSGTAPALVRILDTPFLPVAAQSFLERMMRTQTLIQTYVANVPGPKQPLTVAGAPLRALIPIIPLMGNVPIAVAAVSYAGRLIIGVRSDTAAVRDIDAFLSGMVATFAQLGVNEWPAETQNRGSFRNAHPSSPPGDRDDAFSRAGVRTSAHLS